MVQRHADLQRLSEQGCRNHKGSAQQSERCCTGYGCWLDHANFSLVVDRLVQSLKGRARNPDSAGTH